MTLRHQTKKICNSRRIFLNVLSRFFFEYKDLDSDTNLDCTITNAKYKNKNWNKVMDTQYKYILEFKQKEIFSLWNKYEDLLNGALGILNNIPVDFELKDDEIHYDHIPIRYQNYMQ